MFESLRAALKFGSIASKWAKSTGVDPGDKGQISKKAKSYMDNLKMCPEDAWLTALVNWMLEMPWDDSRKLLANGLIEFLDEYEGKVPLSSHVIIAARNTANEILTDETKTSNNNSFNNNNDSNLDTKEKFKNKVDELLNVYTMDIDYLNAATFETQKLIDKAYEDNYSVYEAASGIAHAYSQLLKAFDVRTGEALLHMWAESTQVWFDDGHVQKDRIASAVQNLTMFVSKIHGLPYGQGSNNADATTGYFCFSVSMPDIRRFNKKIAYESNELIIRFGENIPSLSSQITGRSLPIEFTYGAVAINKKTTLPQFFVTLEKIDMSNNMLCTFDRNGVHNNYGKNEKLIDMNFFIVKSLEMIKEEFGCEKITEIAT